MLSSAKNQAGHDLVDDFYSKSARGIQSRRTPMQNKVQTRLATQQGNSKTLS